MRAVPDQVSRFIDRPYTSLGTDGFGRSDAREALRSHFEINAAHVVIAVLGLLAQSGRLEPSVVEGAIADLGVDPAKAPPFLP
jgi:pyruvate dehydrogenase E1 component